MRIYVAGRFQSFQKVREVQSKVRELGHEISYDWTQFTEKTRAEKISTGTYPALDPGTEQMRAESDVYGVESADLLILCADDSLAGAWVEMGIAIAHRIPIIVIKPERRTIFLRCRTVTVLETYDELLPYLETLS